MNVFPVEISYEGVKYSFTVKRQAPDAFKLSINGQVRQLLSGKARSSVPHVVRGPSFEECCPLDGWDVTACDGRRRSC